MTDTATLAQILIKLEPLDYFSNFAYFSDLCLHDLRDGVRGPFHLRLEHALYLGLACIET